MKSDPEAVGAVADRVALYLDTRASLDGLDPHMIHAAASRVSDHESVELTVADLRTLIDAARLGTVLARFVGAEDEFSEVRPYQHAPGGYVILDGSVEVTDAEQRTLIEHGTHVHPKETP